MPTTLGQEIGINLDKLIGKFDISIINQIKSEKDLNKYEKKNNINIENRYWKSSNEFLIHQRKDNFRTKEYIKQCKYKNKESSRKNLNRLIEIGLIKRVKKGEYIVLFDFK